MRFFFLGLTMTLILSPSFASADEADEVGSSSDWQLEFSLGPVLSPTASELSDRYRHIAGSSPFVRVSARTRARGVDSPRNRLTIGGDALWLQSLQEIRSAYGETQIVTQAAYLGISIDYSADVALIKNTFVGISLSGLYALYNETKLKSPGFTVQFKEPERISGLDDLEALLGLAFGLRLTDNLSGVLRYQWLSDANIITIGLISGL